MSITKADLCQRVAKKGNYKPVKNIKSIVELFLEEIILAAAAGERIEIRGFGCFNVKKRQARIARNPRTGETVSIPEYTKPLFKFSDQALKKFNAILNKPEKINA